MFSSTSRTRIAERALFLCLALLILPAQALPAPKVYLDITKAAGRKISIAVTPLSLQESRSESEIRGVIEQDLRLTGLFEMLAMKKLQLDLYRHEEESGKVVFKSWTEWGAELVLRAGRSETGKGVLLKGQLYDAARGGLLLGREYRGRSGQDAQLAHALVDDVVRTLTGEEGIARTRIAFALNDAGPKRIGIMDYDGRNPRPVSPEGVLSLYPSWFPDGRRLAYVSYRHGRTEVVVHDLETGRIRSLAFFPGMNAFPDVSPDGKELLLSLSRDGNPEIYRMHVDGSSLKRLTYDKAVEASPSWSPDKREFAFISDRTGSPQIFVAGSRGGRARRISYTGHYSSSPDWSPKGDEIVFTSLTEGTFQLFIADLRTGENRQLTFDAGNKEDPSWAPNGRQVIFSHGRSSNYRLAIIDSRTGETFTLPRKSGSYTSPTWSQ